MSTLGWMVVSFSLMLTITGVIGLARQLARTNEKLNDTKDEVRGLAKRYYELDNALKFRKASNHD